jgi:WD40 repeat protein
VTVRDAPAEAPPVEDPYVGLTYFTEEYVDFFFGRDNESALIIGNLRASRLTLLYAESGVGKSSVLRAGVVAGLRGFAARERPGSGAPRLVPVVFKAWSERPIAGLVRELGEAIRPYLEDADFPELPEDDLEAALEAACEALGSTVLVILDQFEEHFLYARETPERELVAAQIARCINRPNLRANFLISIREDSYAELGDLFRGKVKNVYSNFLHLDFLSRAGGREAIERPIERLNERRPGAEPFGVEPALVDAVLDQARRSEGDERIETTYLQLVMRRLWKEETEAGSHVLRLETLERLGGVEAIIGSHLDRAMEGDADSPGLTPGQRLIAARIFRHLVTSGGTKIALTAGDLAEFSELPVDRIEPVLRHLSSSQLNILRRVVFQEDSEPRYEIFHDALSEPIREWRIKIEREESDRERAEKEAAEKAAAAAECRAEEERKRKRVAQGLLGLAVALLVIGAVVFAISQKNLADQREDATQSVRSAERISELAHRSTFGPTAAALASLEAYRLSPTVEARERTLAQLQLNPGMPRIVAGHTRMVMSVAYWPGSEKLVSGGSDGTLRLWDEQGREIGSPRVIPRSSLTPVQVAVSKPAAGRSRIVAAGTVKGRVELLGADDSGWTRSYPPIEMGRSGELWGVAFDPRAPRVLAVGGEDGRLTLWGLDNPRHPVELGTRQVPGKITSIAFTSGGGYLFVAGSNGVERFKLSGRGFAAERPGRGAGAWNSVATAPNGSYALGGDNQIEVWDAARHRTLYLQPLGTVYGLGFARGSSVLVSAGADGNVTTWDVASGRPFGPSRVSDGEMYADLAISPDGRTIAAAGGDRLLKLWPLEPPRSLATIVGGLSPEEAGYRLPWIYDLAVGRRGRVVAAAGLTGTSIWSLRKLADTGSVPHPVARIKGESRAVAFHGDILVIARGHSFVVEGFGPACPAGAREPCRLGGPRRAHSQTAPEDLAFAHHDGRLLLASTGKRRGDAVFNLWDLTDVEKEGRIVYLSSRRTKGVARIFDLAFNPSSALVAAAAEDGKMRVWDVSHPRHPQGIAFKNPRGNENQAVYAVAFSRDGNWLASGGADQQVVLWRVAHRDSGEVAVEETAGTMSEGTAIFALAFSPDDKTLAASNATGATCLYQVESRQAIGDRSCLHGHTVGAKGWVRTVKFARLAGGEPVLLTAGNAQPITAWNSILWNLSDSDRVEEAITADVCTLARRNLTEYEWRSVFASTNLAGDRHQTCPDYPLP